MTAACSGGLPCEKFKRKTLAPPRKSERIVAGPATQDRSSQRSSCVFARVLPWTCQPCAPVPAGSCAGLSALKSVVDEIARSARPPLSRATGGELSRVAADSRAVCGIALYRARQFVGARSERERPAARVVTRLANVTGRRRQSTGSNACSVAPVPHVPVIAPLRHAPLVVPQAQRQQVNRHELAKTAPTRAAQSAADPANDAATQPRADAEHRSKRSPSAKIPAAPVDGSDRRPVAVSVKTASDRGSLACALDSAGRSRDAAAAAASARPAPSPRRAGGAKARPSRAPAYRRRRSQARAGVWRRCQHEPAPVSGVPKPAPTSTAPAHTAGPLRSRRRAVPPPRRDHAEGTGPKSGTSRTVRSPCARRPRRVRGQRPLQRNSKTLRISTRSCVRCFPNNPVNPTTAPYTPTTLCADASSRRRRPTSSRARSTCTKRKGIGSEERVQMWVDGDAQSRPDDDLHRLARTVSTARTRRICRTATSGNVQGNVHRGRQTVRRSRSAGVERASSPSRPLPPASLRS